MPLTTHPGSLFSVKRATATLFITGETAEECDAPLQTGKKKRRKKKPHKTPTLIASAALEQLRGKNVNAGCEKLERGAVVGGSTVLGEKPWGSGRGASAEAVGAEMAECRRTDHLQTSFDICVRRTRCEQDWFDCERHTVPFSLFQPVLDPAPVPSMVPAKEKKKYIFFFL